MAVREVLKMGDPRLLRQAQPVRQFDTDELHLLITDMLDTMQAEQGAGLAAPQIGVDLQVVVFGRLESNPRYPNRPMVPPTVLINPVITPLPAVDDAQGVPPEDEDWEGCLSVPGLRGKVPRFSHIRYTGFDQFGDPIERTVEGFHARVVQHECDHLIGKLYPMRMRDFTLFGFEWIDHFLFSGWHNWFCCLNLYFLKFFPGMVFRLFILNFPDFGVQNRFLNIHQTAAFLDVNGSGDGIRNN